MKAKPFRTVLLRTINEKPFEAVQEAGGEEAEPEPREADATTQFRRFSITISDARFTINGSPAILALRGTDDMSMQTDLEALIEAAQHLTREEQQKLLDALRSSRDLEPPHRITEMRGLGKDLWRGVDPRDYLNAERDSWDN